MIWVREVVSLARILGDAIVVGVFAVSFLLLLAIGGLSAIFWIIAGYLLLKWIFRDREMSPERDSRIR